ncbi:MAG: hypothetical protein LBU46_00135 [Candidatus Accumulibacter sp.]|nr:hypothetical protein [Accumulibacter sp.]
MDKIVTAAPELAGKTVPGYGKGLTYESNDALTRMGSKQILIAEQALDPSTQTWMTGPPDRGARAVRHETGHALTFIHEMHLDPDIVAAWTRERQALLKYDTSQWSDRKRQVFDYVTQDYPSGLLETIGELYAQLRGGGTGDELEVASFYPETAKALKKLFERLKI